jgi:hypothetical protein
MPISTCLTIFTETKIVLCKLPAVWHYSFPLYRALIIDKIWYVQNECCGESKVSTYVLRILVIDQSV